jgi:prephenate dehydrogenase
MLSYDEDSGILWIHPMFGAEVNKERIEKHSIIATIDDCECLLEHLAML